MTNRIGIFLFIKKLLITIKYDKFLSTLNRCPNCNRLIKLLEILAQKKDQSKNNDVIISKAECSSEKGLCNGMSNKCHYVMQRVL